MPAISAVNQTGLVYTNELKRYLFSKKIIILFIIFAGILFLFSLAAIKLPEQIWEGVAKNADVSKQEVQQLKMSLSAAKNHPNPVARHIFSIPPINLLVFTISWMFLPLIIFILGYNAISGEVYQKNIQYYLLRVPRTVFFTGKLLANITAILLILFLSNLLILLYAKGKLLSTDFSSVFQNMLVFDLYLVVFSLCYIGFIFLLSSVIQRPPIVLLMAFVLPIFAGFLRVGGLGFLLPSSYLRYFYHPDSAMVIKAVIAYGVFAIVYALTALYVFVRKDLA